MTSLKHALSLLTEGVKVNSMRREAHAGRSFWVKKRRLTAEVILRVANGFFAVAGAPLRAILPTSAWQQWEVECFIGLHGGEGFTAHVEGARAMSAEVLPGISLTDYLDTGRLTPSLAAAAGRELRRAHAWHSPGLGALWSHGDAHAGNFVLEEHELRARIIDFELTHLATLPANVRHADDVAGFLLDLVGRIAADRWLPCAIAFLEAYDRPEIVGALPGRLAWQRGGLCALLWRRVQTGFLARCEYERRMAQLLAAEIFQPPAAQPSELVASTHSATGTPPSKCS
ncbi:MAG TPA: hypothetical protein VGO11_02550 [Chthoniobacteraceae bacterium]|jgi:hypothetical protein|nr:hypothetical protein [Chthoniobacteraceae bacterium]